MFRIYFNDIGIDKVTDFKVVDDETLEDAENTALTRCRSFLQSNKIMLLHRGSLLYDVRDGMELVGSVMIRSI